jgi:hypothetical protein
MRKANMADNCCVERMEAGPTETSAYPPSHGSVKHGA